MLNFCSLYSSSSGNSLLVQTENTKLLIDAGVSSKKIEQALEHLDVDPHSIDGILITHEHQDHVKGLGTFSKKFNLPVYVNSKTLDAMPTQRDKILENNIKSIEIGDKFCINDLNIKSFSIPHDAANPCGFNIWKDNTKISIATDIGHMTNDILKNLEESIFVMLEANYDPEILKCSSYPFPLKTRIAGPNGHLSNEMAGKTISHLIKSGLKNAILGHLSRENNFPELAYKTVIDEIIINRNEENSINLSVANRDLPGKLVCIQN